MSSVSHTALGVLSALALAAAVWSTTAAADQPPAVARIGVLNPQTASDAMEAALRKGLAQLGYVEGRNLLFEWRRGAASPEQMRAMAADLAKARVDLIVSMGSPATRAAIDSSNGPIVFLAGDPVGTGFAQSLGRPGGRATGVSVVYTELITKHLELLHELAPRARHVIVLTNFSNPGTPRPHSRLEHAAKDMGLHLVPLSAANKAEMEAGLPRISRSTGDAVLVGGDLLALAHRHEIAQAVRKAGLPAMFPFKQYHEAGVLISYGPNYEAAMGQMAAYVDRILKGAKPAEMPIEQVSKYELVVNLRMAQEIGIEVPESILVRADEVIR